MKTKTGFPKQVKTQFHYMYQLYKQGATETPVPTHYTSDAADQIHKIMYELEQQGMVIIETDTSNRNDYLYRVRLTMQGHSCVYQRIINKVLIVLGILAVVASVVVPIIMA
jgi:hypothetical protein